MSFRPAAGAALGAFVAAAALFALLRGHDPQDFVTRFQATVLALGAAGFLAAIAAQTLVVMTGVLPASLLCAAIGATYGVVFGFAIAASSVLIGALAAFWVSRFVLRDLAARIVAKRPKLKSLDERVARDGWRVVCLLRVSPVTPFSATSYALGATSISARDYFLGTLAALPALLGYVTLGALAQDGLAAWSAGAGALRMALIGVGVLGTAALLLRSATLLRGLAAAPAG